METESITVDPFAKAKKLSFTDLTGAGKPVYCADEKSQRRVGCVGTRTANGLRVETHPTGPDSQNPLRFLIARSSEKPSKMDGNS